MKPSFKQCLLASVIAVLPFAGTPANANVLYLTQYSGNSGAIVDTATLTTTGTFSTGVSTETAIAVRDTIRIMNGFGGAGAGSEYDLAGNVINAGIYSQNAYASLYDGTTDGSYNYAIDHNGNGFATIFRFDLNWGNGLALFSANQRSSGIAYDSLTNSLWTTGGPGAPTGNIQQYSMTGTLLSEFSPTTGLRYGIAFDALTNSLWTGKFGDGSSSLEQYSTSGVLLQHASISGLNFDNPFGMEFQLGGTSVPDSGATAALFGFAIAAIFGLKTKLSKRR